MATKKELREIVKKIKAHQEVIAKERDDMREILDELEDLVGSASDGVDALADAINIITRMY